jgi:hypothetical protein
MVSIISDSESIRHLGSGLSVTLLGMFLILTLCGGWYNRENSKIMEPVLIKSCEGQPTTPLQFAATSDIHRICYNFLHDCVKFQFYSEVLSSNHNTTLMNIIRDELVLNGELAHLRKFKKFTYQFWNSSSTDHSISFQMIELKELMFSIQWIVPLEMNTTINNFISNRIVTHTNLDGLSQTVESDAITGQVLSRIVGYHHSDLNLGVIFGLSWWVWLDKLEDFMSNFERELEMISCSSIKLVQQESKSSWLSSMGQSLGITLTIWNVAVKLLKANCFNKFWVYKYNFEVDHKVFRKHESDVMVSN